MFENLSRLPEKTCLEQQNLTFSPQISFSLSLRWVTAKPLKITEAGTTTKVWTNNTYCKPQQKAGLPHTWVSDQQKFEEIIAETHEHIQKNKQPDSFLVLYWNYYTSKPDSTVTRCFYKYNPCFNVNYQPPQRPSAKQQVFFKGFYFLQTFVYL